MPWNSSILQNRRRLTPAPCLLHWLSDKGWSRCGVYTLPVYQAEQAISWMSKWGSLIPYISVKIVNLPFKAMSDVCNLSLEMSNNFPLKQKATNARVTTGRFSWHCRQKDDHASNVTTWKVWCAKRIKKMTIEEMKHILNWNPAEGKAQRRTESRHTVCERWIQRPKR